LLTQSPFVEEQQNAQTIENRNPFGAPDALAEVASTEASGRLGNKAKDRISCKLITSCARRLIRSCSGHKCHPSEDRRPPSLNRYHIGSPHGELEAQFNRRLAGRRTNTGGSYTTFAALRRRPHLPHALEMVKGRGVWRKQLSIRVSLAPQTTALESIAHVLSRYLERVKKKCSEITPERGTSYVCSFNETRSFVLIYRQWKRSPSLSVGRNI